MYQFIFLGTANAFYDKSDNFQSNLLIIAPGNKKLLIDCGSDARRALARMDMSYKDIDNVYITHLHSDHIGGLEWLALSRYFDPLTVSPNLYGEEIILNSIWDHSLRGGLSSLDEIAQLDMFFNPIICRQNHAFQWEGLSCTPIFSFHSPHGDGFMPCFGLFIESDNTSVFFTSDTRFTPDHHLPIFKKADMIFHDCETTDFHTGVHAHYDQLKTYPDDIKKKMYLYHYHSESGYDTKQDGFIGFVKPQVAINMK